jgi:hypothetical protein
MNKHETLKKFDTTSTIRPTKIAFLIDLKWVNYKKVLDFVIPYLCSHWGGQVSFILPIIDTDDLYKNERIIEWLELLKKFDPDTIVSTTKTTDRFQNEIIRFTNTENFFEFHSPSIGGLETHNLIHIDKIFHPLDSKSQAIDFCKTFDPITDLWFFGIFGRYGSHVVKKSSVTTTSLSKSEIDSSIRKIIDGEFRSSTSPFQQTLKGLGARGVKDIADHYLEERKIIIGDTIQDWALYQSLRALSFMVYWIPCKFLETTNYNGCYALLDLLDVNSGNNSYRKPVILSASLDYNTLKRVVVTALQSSRSVFLPKQQVVFKLSKTLDILGNWLSWGESNNYIEKCLITDEKGVSIEKLPKIKPKNVTVSLDRARYKVNVLPHNYLFLNNPLLDSQIFEWENPRSVVKEDWKINYDGSVSYNPIHPLTRQGQDLESALRSPRLVFRTLYDSIAKLFSLSGIETVKTPETWNVENCLSLWGNDLTLFTETIFTKDIKRLFLVFKENNNQGIRQNVHGLQSSAGIMLEKKFFFSSVIDPSSFSPPLSELSNIGFIARLLDSKIIIRGERLVCQECGAAKFYNESEISSTFACKNCSLPNSKSTTTMQSLSPRVLYSLNPFMYQLFSNNDHVVIKTIHSLKNFSKSYFEWNSNILLMENNKKKQEVDIFANVDGELFVGECKSNSKIDKKQILSYKNLCRDFQIFNIVFGSENEWSQAQQDNISSFFSDTPNIKIHFI